MSTRWRLAVITLLACGSVASCSNVVAGHPAVPKGYRTTLDHAVVEKGVRDVLTTYGIRPVDLEQVSCPSSQPVVVGTEFECAVTVGGLDPHHATVQVRVTGEDGSFRVSAPSPP